MPGLVVTTGVRIGATGTTDAPSSSLFIVGTAERGPVGEYRLIESMAQAEATYGGYVADCTLYQHLEVFFEEGGTRAYVVRVCGEDGSTASSTVFGTNSLILEPVGQGTWANGGNGGAIGLTAEILDGVTPLTRRIRVRYNNEILFTSGDCGSNRALAEAVNANVGTYFSATYDTTDALVSVAGADWGTDGVDANGIFNDGGPADSVLVGALGSFVPELGAGVVAIPEYYGPTIWDGIRQHCLDNSRIGFCSFASDITAIDGTGGAIDVLNSGDTEEEPYWGTNDDTKTKASVLAFYWPFVTAPNGTGGTRTLSPETFAAAARCRAHLQTGPWRPNAGIISASKFVNGLSQSVDSATSDKANAARINPLRVIDGGVRVYGARSISADETNWRYITYRDTLNYIVVVAEKRLEPFIFNVIDSRRVVFSDISATLVNLLEPLRAAGGLYEGKDASGNTTDRGYVVEVSDALNPQAQLASGTIAAKVGVRVSSVGETINLLITKSNLTTAI
jgi:hypothetical protein